MHRVRITLQATCAVAFLTPQIAACGASRFQEAVFAECARTDEPILGSLASLPAPMCPLKWFAARLCLRRIVLPNTILGKPAGQSRTLDSSHASTLLSTPSTLRLQAWFKSTVGRAVFADTHLTAGAQSLPTARLRSFSREAGTLEGRRGVCPDPRRAARRPSLGEENLPFPRERDTMRPESLSTHWPGDAGIWYHPARYIQQGHLPSEAGYREGDSQAAALFLAFRCVFGAFLICPGIDSTRRPRCVGKSGGGDKRASVGGSCPSSERGCTKRRTDLTCLTKGESA